MDENKKLNTLLIEAVRTKPALYSQTSEKTKLNKDQLWIEVSDMLKGMSYYLYRRILCILFN